MTNDERGIRHSDFFRISSLGLRHSLLLQRRLASAGLAVAGSLLLTGATSGLSVSTMARSVWPSTSRLAPGESLARPSFQRREEKAEGWCNTSVSFGTTCAGRTSPSHNSQETSVPMRRAADSERPEGNSK